MKKKKDRLNKFYILLIAFGFVIFLLVRMKVHHSSLENDEGHYAYAASQILQGNYLYKNVHLNKPPGIVLIYALAFKLFGESSFAIKLIGTVSILFSSIFVFFISKKMYKLKAAIFSTLLFLLSFSSPFIQSANSNSEIFMMVFLLLSAVILLQKISLKNLLFSGLVVGVGFVIKQSALGNWAAVVVWLLFFEKKEFIKKFIFFTLGFLIPVGLVIFYYAKNSLLSELWWSNVTFNYGYVNQNPIWIRWIIFPYEIILENPAVWLFGLFSVILLFLKKIKTKKPRLLYLMSLYFLFPLVLIQLTGFGWAHYYIQLTPFLVILSVFGISHSFRCLRKIYIYGILSGLLLISFIFIYTKVISKPNNQLIGEARISSRGKWYDESIALSDYLRKYVSPNDYIYVLGRDAQIYFYTGTQSPTAYLNDRVFYYFPQILIKSCGDMSKNKPKLVVNTLRAPEYSEDWAQYLWSELKKCGNLEVEKKEKVYFAEVWFLK